MRLDGALIEAGSGLDSISKRLSTVAQNVSNANTPGYVRETVQVNSLAAAGDGAGVRTGNAVRDLDTALQAEVVASGADVAGGSVRQQALAGIDAASGTVGDGSDLGSLVGALRDSFSTLLNDPANQTQQQAVVQSAGDLARAFNSLSSTIVAARQTAQDGLGDDVKAANTALAQVGTLSDQIITARARGESTADLEDQRDTAIQTVANLTGAKAFPQSNGDVLLFSGGTALPTRASSGPLAIGSGTIGANTPASAVPALTVSGSQAPIAGGRIGAELALRDTELPGLQAGLDGLAQNLATGFQSAGLALFTAPNGTVPATTTAGFAQTLQVNPAVQSTPSAVRDGLGGGAGSAGSTTLIQALLSGPLTTGAGSIADQASNLVANTATTAAAAQSGLDTATAVQTSLTTKLQSQTAVSIDSELSSMVSLQNSYAANAKVIAAVQTMWTSLLSSVT